MSSFTTPLIVIPLDDGRRWKLHREFTYHVGTKYSNEYVHVPAGFITDFASIPWVFWTFLPSWGRYGKAAVLHDWLYHSQGRTRDEADNLFLEAMLVSGTATWKAHAMHQAVRLFGWLAWRKRG